VQRLDTDHGLSVVNLGLDGNGSMSHLRILQTFGLPYKPRMVIWQWYGNDFNDDYGLVTGGDVVNPFLVAPPSSGKKTGKNPSIRKWLIQNSAVYFLSTLGLSAWTGQSGLTLFRDPYQVHDGTIDFSYGRPYIQESFDLSNPKNQRGLEATQQAVREARDTLTAAGISLVIVLIPSKEEVYRPWTQGRLGPAWFDTVGEGRQKMLDLCHAESLLCLDLTPVLVEHANRRELVYWPDDIHLNPAGNKIIADAITDTLRQQSLVN
jgi:hypothetical protein